MLNKYLLEELMSQASTWKGPVLSMFLSVDPARQSNLNQGYLARFRVAVQRLENRLANDAEAATLMRSTAAEIHRELENYKPNAKTLVIIRDGADGKEWRRELHVPIPEIVEWSGSPYLLPLAEALDEHERYAVALLDRGRARIFVVHAGEVEEVSDLSTVDVSHRKSSGKDHLWSNANFQRRADTHATRHIQATLDSLSKIVDRLCVDRVLLAGSVEARKELEHLLPKRLRGKLAGSIPLPVTSTVTQVIRAVQEIGSQAERRGEDELVSALVDSAGKQDRAVTGLQATVVALRESDVARLVVSGDYHPTWDDLPELEIWLRSDAPDRPDDLTESLVEKTLQRGGRVEVVWGKAASHLQKEGGGIGAFLRF